MLVQCWRVSAERRTAPRYSGSPSSALWGAGRRPQTVSPTLFPQVSVPGPWRLEGALDPPVPVFGPFSLVELTEEILKLLMDLVFRLVCNGELSLARVLRKNILDKVDQKKLLRCASSGQPLAAKGVAAR